MKVSVLSLVALLTIFSSCKKDDDITQDSFNYKQEMREFVIGISEYSKEIKSSFYIIPQNGIELVSSTGEGDGQPHAAYLNAIDGNGQEDLFYGYVSFSANHRELDNIPVYPNAIYAENSNQINSLSEIENFLYLINPENFTTKMDFIIAVISTNYDLLILDLFFRDGTEFTSSELNQLKNKANGGSRLIISYMSIGEAENYRYYWDIDWNSNKPSWLDNENPDWEGNFKVKYWNQDWKNIIYGNDNSYLKKILDANFDGVYLDIIDAFEYYE